ncbi:hypothetical protein DPMN_030971 [Dreissena polymorpha]|uniref:Uncharacterized protein n=1 Tax=Dreissena polymorpha TaxID=45954 RepID=A0A9D4M1W0_DREPO|nr:hypothetical protein DPMN_030971 [Dreissena polymorpha]
MILKSDNERHSYGPDKLVPPASQPARIRQSNNQFFPSENLVKNASIIDHPENVLPNCVVQQKSASESSTQKVFCD